MDPADTALTPDRLFSVSGNDGSRTLHVESARGICSGRGYVRFDLLKVYLREKNRRCPTGKWPRSSG